MAIGAGLAAQVGIANETTPNTPVAVTTFTKFLTETLEARPNFVQGAGLGGALLIEEAARRYLVSQDAGGGVTFEVPNKGLGKWMQAMMGSYSTATTQLGASAAYQQIHNVGSTDGKSFTLQKGIPDIAGTVNPLTLAGCKVMDWTLTSSPNAIATLALTIDAQSVQPTGAGALGLQTASYSASTALYTFNELQAQTFAAYTTAAGLWTPTSPTEYKIRNLTLKGGQPKDNTRWVSNTTTKAEQVVNNWQPVTGTLDIDFGVGASAMAWYNQFVGNSSIGLQLTFTGPLIASTYFNTLQFTMPAIFLEQGTTPQVSGPGVVSASIPFTALSDASGNALQSQIISTDTTV